MAKRFDVDHDHECCGLVGGELTSGYTVGRAEPDLYDFEPGALMDFGAQHKIRVLGTLDMNELHCAKEGTREMERHSSSGLPNAWHTAREGTRDE